MWWEVSESGICVAGKVQAGVELVDTSGSGMVSGKVLKSSIVRRRHHYSGGGGGLNGKLMMKPELRGVLTSIDRTLVQSGCKNRLKQSAIAGQILPA